MARFSESVTYSLDVTHNLAPSACQALKLTLCSLVLFVYYVYIGIGLTFQLSPITFIHVCVSVFRQYLVLDMPELFMSMWAVRQLV